jgi:hypothetical protein
MDMHAAATEEVVGVPMTELLESLTWWAWLITLLLGAVAVAAVFVLGYLIYLGAVKQMIEDRQRRKLWLKVNGIGQR